MIMRRVLRLIIWFDYFSWRRKHLKLGGPGQLVFFSHVLDCFQKCISYSCRREGRELSVDVAF